MNAQEKKQHKDTLKALLSDRRTTKLLYNFARQYCDAIDPDQWRKAGPPGPDPALVITLAMVSADMTDAFSPAPHPQPASGKQREAAQMLQTTDPATPARKIEQPEAPVTAQSPDVKKAAKHLRRQPGSKAKKEPTRTVEVKNRRTYNETRKKENAR